VDYARLSDEELLARAARREAAAYGAFYARHERAVFRFLRGRVVSTDVAADLAAETFAAALLAARRFRAGPEPAIAWLLGIARNVLRRSLRQRRVEDRARRRLGMPVLQLTDEQLEVLDRLHAGERLGEALTHLSPAQRDAVTARIVDEDEYSTIAARLQTSEAVVRKRVSRGLAALRAELEGRQ
jgi:RNA polymerase sigma factor (sigma-70 family)